MGFVDHHNSNVVYFDAVSFIMCILRSEFVGEWTPSDDPLVEHQTLFPHCPFVQGQPVGNVPLGEDEETSLDLQGPSYSWSSGSYSDSTGEQQRTARGVDETGMRERRRYLNSGPERGEQENQAVFSLVFGVNKPQSLFRTRSCRLHRRT